MGKTTCNRPSRTTAERLTDEQLLAAIGWMSPEEKAVLFIQAMEAKEPGYTNKLLFDAGVLA